MTMCELATIVQEKIKVNIAIINNGFLGMVRQWQEFFYESGYVATPMLHRILPRWGMRSGFAASGYFAGRCGSDNSRGAREQRSRS